MLATVLRRTPVPIVVVEQESPASAVDDDQLFHAVQNVLGDSAEALLFEGCRAVPADRLAYVLEHGVDVDPTTAVIWVNFLSKALEYGGYAKLIEVFDLERLELTFREVPANTTAEDLAVLAESHPTRLTSEDGEMLWLSRLSASDRRISSPYEVAYGRWIPANPWAALLPRCLTSACS
jgi:hypothetical protein